MKKSIFVVSFFLLFCSQGLAADYFKSGPERTAFIELYTSETRKGSPAAESWLNALGKSPLLWKKVFPVAFHVNYGDKPGWIDKFVKKEFTNRFLDYAKKWGVQIPYVPTVFVNGTEWSGWAREERLPPLGSNAGILEAKKITMDEFSVTFDPVDQSPASRWTANGAFMLLGLKNKVEAGENLGKLMTHDFTAVRLASKPMEIVRGRYKASLKLSLKSDYSSQGSAAVFWITRGEDIIPVQATGGFIKIPFDPKKAPSAKIKTETSESSQTEKEPTVTSYIS